ncbi:MAG: phosphocholine cytidylyltransferase family protein [Candidatus Marinimicrobia bacterium]|nr:phosphocholine cytidylyltransferase family protein [Candidatus Neomarinimicrobiota bacterium]
MSKISKTIKISISHEEWLKAKKINFSEWVRQKLDAEINQQLRSGNRNKFKAVILAAGKDTTLFPLTNDIPKALLDIKGKSILQRQVEMLRTVGINDIAVVRGYKKDQINFPNLEYFDNDDYENTGILVSLFLAREFMDKDMIILYGDILFEIDILKRLIETRHDTTLVVDRGWKKRYQVSHEEHPFAPELTRLSEKEQEIEISSVGIGMPETNSTSEFIGLAKLSTNACSILKDLYKNVYCINQNKKFHQAKQIRTASFLDFIQELLDRGEKVAALEIWRAWIDIDTFEDYRNAWKSFSEVVPNKE